MWYFSQVELAFFTPAFPPTFSNRTAIVRTQVSARRQKTSGLHHRAPNLKVNNLYRSFRYILVYQFPVFYHHNKLNRDEPPFQILDWNLADDLVFRNLLCNPPPLSQVSKSSTCGSRKSDFWKNWKRAKSHGISLGLKPIPAPPRARMHNTTRCPPSRARSDCDLACPFGKAPRVYTDNYSRYIRS